MAVTLEFQWSTTTVDLTAALGADAGISTLEYAPAAGDIGGGLITDRIRVQVDGASDDALAGYVQALDQMAIYAMRYRGDPTFEHPVWLYAQMDEEAGKRRAWVRSIEMEWNSNPHAETGLAPDHMAEFALRVERGPWENPTNRASVIGGGGDVAVVYDHTSAYDVAGDVPARIASLYTYLSAGSDLGRYWMGFRSAAKHGTLANFVPIWELEVDGATVHADVSYHVVATASDTTTEAPADYTIIRVTEGATDWDDGDFHMVEEISIEDITAHESDQFGDFLWLLRARVRDADEVWEVQARWGYEGMADDDFVRGRIVEVSGAADAWDYYEMGRAPIPLRDLHVFPLSLLDGDHEETYAVQLWARRTAVGGTEALDLDCLILVPIDEGWLKADGFSGTPYLIVGESPEGDMQGLTYKAGQMQHVAAISAQRFRIPVGDGRLIIVYAGATATVLTDAIWVIISNYYERWLNLRGAE